MLERNLQFFAVPIISKIDENICFLDINTNQLVEKISSYLCINTNIPLEKKVWIRAATRQRTGLYLQNRTSLTEGHIALPGGRASRITGKKLRESALSQSGATARRTLYEKSVARNLR